MDLVRAALFLKKLIQTDLFENKYKKLKNIFIKEWERKKLLDLSDKNLKRRDNLPDYVGHNYHSLKIKSQITITEND